MKPLVTDYHTVNITELARGRWLSPYSKYEWVWRFQNGTRTLSVPITVLTDSLQLLYPMGTHRVRQEVQLTHSRRPHGGTRPWFVCPTCHRRVGILYHADGLPFRCRLCSGLVYPSQYPYRSQSSGRGLRGVNGRERLTGLEGLRFDDFERSAAPADGTRRKRFQETTCICSR